MKRIYVSLPISGYDLDKRKLYAIWVKELIKDKYSEPVEVITPFNVCSEPDKPYSYYMGKDIEILLECDTVYFCKGWQDSKGCMAEFAVAKIYGKKIIME